MHHSLRSKVLAWFVTIIAAIVVAGWIGYTQLSRHIHKEANAQIESRLHHVMDILSATDQTTSSLVKASMGFLKTEALKTGAPSLQSPEGGGKATLAFGGKPVAGSFEIVDVVKSVMGGTATLFVRDGERFFRVSTNVLKPDGSRAIGTELNPNGPAIRELREGRPFYGVVDILGKPYLTAYEPIRDEAGEIIGVYYVGYALETLTAIGETINNNGLLKRGFFALANSADHVVFLTHSKIDAGQAATAALAAEEKPVGSQWAVLKQTFKPWDYDVVAGLHLPDVRNLALQIIWKVYGVTGFVLLAALGASYWLASKLSTALEDSERSNREAIEARNAAETANRTKSAFLANMSHELRTPMNAIIGYSEMLIEEAEDLEQDEMIPDLQKIRSAGKHLLSLINDVLDLSKIEAGKMTLYLEEFAVEEMLDDVVTTISPLLDQNKNRLVIEKAPGLGTIRADLTKVRQTLFNLLSNATKFTEEGEIRLVASRESTPEAGGTGEYLTLRITDSGIGMTPEQLGRLFQAFTQADASTTRKYGGTGLGLVISRKFCQMMGGDITVKSTIGSGSTFTVILPVAVIQPETEAAAMPENASSLPVPLPRRLVLVIDDDAAAADLIKRSLEKAGYSALIAPDGTTGIAMAREHKPVAITLDVMMPNMDGWSVLTKLKSDPDLAHIPVIMATMLQDRPLGFALGAADFLTKPIDQIKLRALLERLCGKGKGRVLVIDDDAMSRDVLRRLLEKEGITTLEAVNGSAGLEAVAADPPDLILLDLMMPVMDGFDFLAALRANPATRHIPVVVVTAKDLTDADHARLNGSVRDVIQKGALDREGLLREVCAMIALSAPSEKPSQSPNSAAPVQ